MAIAEFTDLTTLVRDYSRSFWNGNAALSLKAADLARALEDDPSVTIARLQQSSSTPLIASGVDFSTPQSVRLGELNGRSQGSSINLTASGGAAAQLLILLSPAAVESLIQNPPQGAPPGLGELLGQYIHPSQKQGVIALTLKGQADGALSGSSLFKAVVDVGFGFKAGAEVGFIYCRPASAEETLIGAIRETFSQARLVQSGLEEAASAGHPIAMLPNELRSSKLTGFLGLSAQATLGYRFNGTRDVSLGKLDLASTLLVEAAAELKAGYQLSGAFEILSTAGAEPGWTRVVVKKDRQSQFDFAFSVSADVKLSTPAAQPGLPLIESLLGTSTGQILSQALAYSQSTPEELRNQADGFLRAVVARWTGRAFYLLPQEELSQALGRLSLIRTQIQGLDERIVSLYLQSLNQVGFSAAVAEISKVLQAGDLDAQKEALLSKIGQPQVRGLVEGLLQEEFGMVFADYQNLHQKLADRVSQMEQLVQGQAAQELKGFVQAKLEAVKLPQLAQKLAQYDSPDKLRSQAQEEVQELASRLVGRPFEAIFGNAETAALVGEINRFGSQFQSLLSQAGDLVSKSLNRQGRLAISYAYQKSSRKDALIDVEIRTGSDASPDSAGIGLYAQAVHGRFEVVLGQADLSKVRVNRALFTQALKRSSQVQAHIFGWSFSGVSTLLSDLQRSIQVGQNGLVTAYSLQEKGSRTDSTRQRSIALNFLLQVSGLAQGAIESDQEMRATSVSVQSDLASLDNRFEFEAVDDLASLDDLHGYFELAVKLDVIDEKGLLGLLETVAKLRDAGMSASNYGKVKVDYDFSFQGTALAKAISTDFSQQMGLSDDNPTALQRIYANRLLATYFVPPGQDKAPAGLGVAALYQGGFLQLIRRKGNIQALMPDLLGTRPYRQGGRQLRVDVRETDVLWAERHYRIARRLAQFLDDFRVVLQKQGKLKWGDLEDFVKDLSVQLEKIAAGPQRALPLLLLDDLVRRSSPGDPQARSALVTVTLFDASGQKELNVIPISS